MMRTRRRAGCERENARRRKNHVPRPDHVSETSEETHRNTTVFANTAAALLAVVPVSLAVPPLACLGIVVVVTAIVVTLESILFARQRAELHAREAA
jgi:hypothetical protein